jgi:RNA polymerase sigma factor (TIGR02999 family)
VGEVTLEGASRRSEFLRDGGLADTHPRRQLSLEAMHDAGEITRLLAAARAGDRRALDRVIPLVYDELSAMAHRQLARERPGHTLNTGALVHEAYLKLVGVERIEWQDRGHFFALSARLMRYILINYAEQHNAAKRGGGQEPVPLEDVAPRVEDRMSRYGALDEALDRLEQLNERQARVVECRFFAGLTIDETAEALETSPATVKRDWALARAWLNRELA